MDVSGQLHASAALPTVEEAVWVPVSVWTLRESLLNLLEIEPRPSSLYPAVIPTKLRPMMSEYILKLFKIPIIQCDILCWCTCFLTLRRSRYVFRLQKRHVDTCSRVSRDCTLQINVGSRLLEAALSSLLKSMPGLGTAIIDTPLCEIALLAY
jgi:hypothetical protein